MSKSSRIVLMHPRLDHLVQAATPDYIDENRGTTPPMGLLYLQAALENSNHESLLLDANVENLDYKQAAKKALEFQPDLIGLQAMSFTLPDAYLQAKAIKELAPEMPIIIGGPHPTIYPIETVELPAVDFAFAGEGEFGLIKFMDVLTQPEQWQNIPGLAYMEKGEARFNPSSGYIEKMDDIPLPARSSTPWQKYGSVLSERDSMTIMITSRGCPFNCIFCNRMGRRYRYHSAEYVLREIDEINKLGIKEIFIHDDTFTLNKSRIKEICEGLIERNYDIVWEARTRVDCVDREMLALMRKAGCTRMSFGVESGSPHVLEKMNKGIELKRVEQVFQWCREVGITTLADFMIGNYGEKMEDIKKSQKLVKKINPDYAQFSICSPYPETPLYKLAIEKGIVKSDVWKEFAKDPMSTFRSPVWTEYFTAEELVKIVAQCYRAFYWRPSFILKQLKKINSFEQFYLMARSAIGMIRK